MAVVGDKYVIYTYQYEDSDTFFANPFINVFAYEATSGTPSAQDLWTVFLLDVVPDWLNCVNVHYVLRQSIIVNLDDPTDFWGDALNDVGDQSGDQLQDFLAFEFQYVRAVRGVHHGRKSFAGLDETMVTGGVPTGSQLSLLNILAADLGALLNSGVGSYTPRIWRRAGKYAPYSGTPPVGTDYPDTFYPISSVQFNRISTQNSRKR